MKLRRRLLAFAAVPLFALAACGDDEALDDDGGNGDGGNGDDMTAQEYQLAQVTDLPPEVQAIADSGTLRVGTKFDQPLFGLQNPTNNQIEGFDTEIARLVSIAIFGNADSVEFSESTSDVREQVIQNGSVDIVVATYTINDERKELVDFAGPYFMAGQDILVAADNTDINGIDDLNGKTVCSQEGSTSIENVREMAPEADVQSLGSYAACAEGVVDGTFDALSTDNVILAGLADSLGSDQVKVVNNTFTEEPYGIGVAKGSDELRDFINDVLEEIVANGDWELAWNKTVGDVIAMPTPPAVDRY